MKPSKWFAAGVVYLAVWVGLFSFKNAWAALLGFHLAILFVLFIARPAIPVNMLLKTGNYTWARRTFFVCALAGVSVYYLHPYLGVAEDITLRLKGMGLNDTAWSWFIGYFALVNPFIEEYFWRGYLRSDTKGFSPVDLLYAGYHGMVLWGMVHPFAVLLALAALTFAGWLWRQIHREDEGLLVPVLGHMAADLSILTAVYLITK